MSDSGHLERLEAATAKVSEIYADEMVPIRAAVSAIPFLGGGLDLILASEGQRAAKRRVLKMLENLKERMDQVEEETVDRSFLESEEFLDLTLQAFHTAARTRDEKKIRLCSLILSESTMHAKRGKYTPEEYLTLVADLTPDELRVARHFYETRAEGEKQGEEDLYEPWRRHSGALRYRLDMDESELQFFMGRLASAGLLLEIRYAYPGTSPVGYILSQTFNDLVEFLEHSI